MRQRQRSPILNILQLAIVGFIFWQESRGMSPDPAGAPAAMFDSVFRSMRLIFLGIIAMAALNVLYPLAAWGIRRLRERQETWDQEERFVVSQTEPVNQRQSTCPNCGASLFEDAPACPWCNYPLR
jgi:hypothetical protein